MLRIQSISTVHHEHIKDDLLKTLYPAAVPYDLHSRQECRCYNPFKESVQSFLGDPSKNCDTKGVCFVPCDSTCEDKEKAVALFAGPSKCVSNQACSLDGGFVADRPQVVVVGGIEQDCAEGSLCEQENIVTFVKKSTQNCKDSNCLQDNN